MSRWFLICLMITTPLFSKENKWIKNIEAYQSDSYYKYEVYEQHTIASFFQLEAIHQLVNPAAIDIHLLNACLFFTLNKLRAMHKLYPYKMDENLKRVATIHSFQMAQYHFFNHTNTFVVALKTPEDRLKVCGIEYTYEGENCHRVSISEEGISYLELAQQVIESLYNSPPHRSNMLNNAFKYGACGIAVEEKKANFYLLVTQNFYTK